jgi:hypothetical protein
MSYDGGVVGIVVVAVTVIDDNARRQTPSP